MKLLLTHWAIQTWFLRAKQQKIVTLYYVFFRGGTRRHQKQSKTKQETATCLFTHKRHVVLKNQLNLNLSPKIKKSTSKVYF